MTDALEVLDVLELFEAVDQRFLNEVVQEDAAHSSLADESLGLAVVLGRPLAVNKRLLI